MWWLTLRTVCLHVIFFYCVFDYKMEGRFAKGLLIAMVTWALFPVSDFLINDWTREYFKVGIPLLGPVSLCLYILLYKQLFRAIKDKQTSENNNIGLYCLYYSYF